MAILEIFINFSDLLILRKSQMPGLLENNKIIK